MTAYGYHIETQQIIKALNDELTLVKGQRNESNRKIEELFDTIRDRDLLIEELKRELSYKGQIMIYIDCDGVLADFNKKVLELTGTGYIVIEAKV